MTDKKIKITSIETDMPSDLPKKQTAGALELSAPMATQTTEAEAQDYSWVKKLTLVTTLIWILLVTGLLMVVLKIDNNWQTYSPLQWTTIAGLILGPILMIFVAGFALKQLAKISGQAYKLAQTADALSSPDNTVVKKSRVMSEAITAQVDQVNEKLNLAVERLASMEEVIQNQTLVLDTANQDSRKTVDKINASVESQNATLAAMTTSLDESMDSLSKNLTMHTDNLAKSVQIAEQKIKEARISVEGATAKINSASDIVRSNTTQASATLSASHEDIKSLGDIIRQRSEELDDVYKKHAGELTAMIEHLRDEQTSLGASMEERLVKMRDLSLSAQASAESLSEASQSGKETIEALAAAATLADNAVKTRFSEMRDMVEYSTEHAQSISDMAAKRVQDSLELTRKEIIRIEQEMADLQTRIGDKKRTSLELISDETEEKNSDTINPSKNRKTRTRLKLKPIIEIETVLDEAETIEPEAIPEPVTTPEIQFEEQPPLEAGDAPIEPDMIRQSTEPLLEPSDIEPLISHVVVPEPDVTPKQEQNQDPFPSFHPLDEAVRRAAPLDEPKKSKAKSGLFGGLFKKRTSSDQSSALDIVGASAPEPLNQNPPPTDDDILLSDLARLGLSANVIVDEGCIIEATNARSTSGHAAMSRSVALRLKQPVEHLVKSLTVDDDLSDKAIIFATRFDRTVELLAEDREAIRTRLESAKGRAYLLCDAALNYGRI